MREAAERHRGREEERLARHELLGLPDVRDDLLVGLARAGASAPASASDAPISFRKLRRPTRIDATPTPAAGTRGAGTRWNSGVSASSSEAAPVRRGPRAPSQPRAYRRRGRDSVVSLVIVRSPVARRAVSSSVRMSYSFTSCAPSSSWSAGGGSIVHR